jgi:uncharacterized phage protein (TIGR01671 family)
MREIKFRAYDKHTKIMLPVVDIIKFTKSEDIYITRDGAYGVGINMQYQPHIELMQYVGLKDKNGKEIYEGDILSNGYEKCIVVWINEQSGFMLKLLDEEYKNEEWTNPMIDLRKDDEVIRKHLGKSRIIGG